MYLFDLSRVNENYFSDAAYEDSERSRFYDVDKLIMDQKLFGGNYEHEADPEEFRVKIEPDIIKADKEFFAQFKSAKTNYLRLNEKISCMKGLMERSHNQAKSMESLIRYIVQSYE